MKVMKDAVRPEPWVEAENYYNSLEEPKKKYTVHYHIQMGYDVVVEADSEEEALEKADEIFDDVPVEDFDFLDTINEGVIDVD